MNKQIITGLIKILGPDSLITNIEERQCYSYDGTSQEYLPDAVALPSTTKQVAAIMKLANQHLLPVTPRGAGTGMTGGSLPIKGGLVLCLSRMNNILEIDQENQIAILEPGVITGQLRQEAAKVNLFYPPDPASLRFCSMGGNIAECAGGPSAVKYGVTRDFVLGLEVVLADGRIINSGSQTNKSVVGYDLTRLFTGSEGTLGIITKIIIRLIKLPTAKTTFLGLFPSITAATNLVARLLQQFTPCTLEYLDQTALSLVKDKLPITMPAQTKAMLIIEVDGNDQEVEITSQHLATFLNQEPATILQSQSTEETTKIWQARRAISPAAFKIKPHKISEDIVVPKNKIPAIVAHTEKLSQELQLTIFTFGHAGDGNIHVNIMIDRSIPQEVERGNKAKERLFKEVIRLNGSLSGEHGIGTTKAEYLNLELGTADIQLMKEIKQAFDSNNILNPGKIFP